MSEFYTVLTALCVIIAVFLFIGLVITFDPIGSLISLLRRKLPERRIRRARQTIERYNLDRVLTASERSAVVLEYLRDNNMIVQKGDRVG